MVLRQTIFVARGFTKSWTALHEACNKGCLEAAEILMKNGANVNACGPEDDTPLHDAALNGNKDLVILLLKNGADACKSNAGGRTPKDVTDDQDIQLLLEKFSLGAIDFSSPEYKTSSSYVDLEEEQEAFGITASTAEKIFEFDGDKSAKMSLEEAQTKVVVKEKMENYKTPSLDTLNSLGTQQGPGGAWYGAEVSDSPPISLVHAEQTILEHNNLALHKKSTVNVSMITISGGDVLNYWNASNKTVYNVNESMEMEKNFPFQKAESESEKKDIPPTIISPNAARKMLNHDTLSASPKSQSRLSMPLSCVSEQTQI
uniref:Uncharacterized protein n=1 Tax=Romanomermis culicivorax TaxID=13658 RepID=A0A915K970_ROMCU